MEKKENLCIWQKSDRRSFSNESGLSRELLQSWYFWQNEPCRLINSWGKVLEYLRFSFAEGGGPFFIYLFSYYDCIKESKRFSLFKCVSPVAFDEGTVGIEGIDSFVFLEKVKKNPKILVKICQTTI